MRLRSRSVLFSVAIAAIGYLGLDVSASTQNRDVTEAYSFTLPEVSVVDGVAEISMAGCERLQSPGAPALPAFDINLLIPADRNVATVDVIDSGYLQIPGTYVVEHASHAYPLSDPASARTTEQDLAIYGSDDLYPADVRQVVGTQRKHGYQILTVRLFPVRYRPASGRLFSVSNMQVRVGFADAQIASAGSQIVVPRRTRPDDAAAIALMVDNADVVATFAPSVPEAGIQIAASLPDGDFEHVIITTDAMQAEGEYTFDGLSRARTASGVPSKVETVEWIEANYTEGDQQKRIRDFIRDAYAEWGTRYVLLGGNAVQLPPRMFRVDGEDMPVDMYFGCLDGSFDSDGDGIYGEPTDGADKGYDDTDVDLLGEVAIGRAPVDSLGDVANFVRKTLAYQASAGEALSGVVMVGEELGFGGVSEFAKNSLEQIRLGGEYDGYTTVGFENSEFADFFETTNALYDEDGTWLRTELIDLMNEGQHVFNHLGHANRTYDMKLTANILHVLTNDNFFVVYSQGCWAGWFDLTSPECFAERITTMENGAFAVVMNARYGWGTPGSTKGKSHRFARKFWDVALGGGVDDGIFEFGWMNQISKERNIAAIHESRMRWCTYELNLFGDPATKFMTAPALDLRLDRLAYRSDATVSVTILDGSAAGITNRLDFAWQTTIAGPADVRTNASLSVWQNPTRNDFSNQFTLVSGATNDAVDGDTLTVSYSPAEADTLFVSVPIDDFAPVISGLVATNATESSIEVKWVTDEPANSHVLISETLPLADGIRYGSDEYVATPTVVGGITQYLHSVEIVGLSEKTFYYAAAISEDYAGNEATTTDIGSTNPNDYLPAVTRYRRVVQSIDFDGGNYAWTHGGVNDSWEYGTPTYGPPDAPFGSKAWGTDLSDRYANAAHMWLKSGAMTIGYQARLTIRMWYDIDWFDKGFIELDDGAGWHNVTQDTDLFSGESSIDGGADDWQTVTLDLSGYRGKTVWIRFRLESNDNTRRAGWYISDAELTCVQPDGVWVENIEIDDSVGGDGDGYAEPGEEFELSVYAGHYEGLIVYSQVVATVECPTDRIRVGSGSETILYGDLEPIDFTRGDRTPLVTVDADVASGTLASFVYSIASTTIPNDGPWQSEFNITIGSREARTGTVSNIVDGLPIEGAEVHATAAGNDDLMAISEADGTYVLNGLVSGVSYEVMACKPGEFSASSPVSATGAEVLDFGLGKAYGGPSSSFSPEVKEGNIAIITLEIVFDNTLGTVEYVYDANIEYEGLDEDDVWIDFSPMNGWLDFSPMTGTVAAGSAATKTITIDPSELGTSYISNRAHVVVNGNDISCEPRRISVDVSIIDAPVLELVSLEVEGGDGDQYLEPNETNRLNIVLRNIGSVSNTVTKGTLSTTGAMMIVSDDAEWPAMGYYPEFASVQESTIDPTVSSGASVDGTVHPLSLAVSSDEGAWQFNFSVTTMVRQAVSGYVYDGVTSNAVAGVQVKARGPAGVESVGLTDATGYYVLYGLTNASYSIVVMPPSDYDSPGAETVTIAGADVAGMDFYLQTWDLALSPASFSKTILEGEDASEMLEVSRISGGSGYVEFKIEQTGTIPPCPPPQEATAVDWAALTAEDCAMGQVFVRFNDNVASLAQSDVLADQGLTIARRFILTDAVLVDLPPEASLSQVSSSLLANNAIAHVEPNYMYRPSAIPNDLLFDELYGLHNERHTGGSLDADIDALEAWDITAGDTNIVVAVIDTGVEIRHEDLEGQCVLGFDFGALTKVDLVTTEADGVTNSFADTLKTAPIIPGSMTVYATNALGDSFVFSDDGSSLLVCADCDVYAHGTIDYETGEWELDFDDNPPLGIINATFTDSDPTPDYHEGLATCVEHGTHVAGTVAAAGNNAMGIIGVAWQTRIMPLKASSNILVNVDQYEPRFMQDAVLAAFDYAVTHGARVSNHSYGGSGFSPIVRSAFSNSMAYGHIIVCAAGNDGADVDVESFYPAGYNLPNIISVAAMDHNDGIAEFSNYGELNVDLGAPGVGILSCAPHWDAASADAVRNTYEEMSGTSMAAPHVAGIMGLLASQAPDAPWETLVQALFDGVRADPNLEGIVRYAGHANAYESLRILRPFWLSIDSDHATIPAGGSATNEVIFNAGKHLTAGAYSAEIVVNSGSHSTNIPVSLTVEGAPRPAVGEIVVVGGDGDGIPEPNETVQLQISLINQGSKYVISPNGMLSTAAATVTSGQVAWNSIQVGGSVVPTVMPEVQFGAGASSSVAFSLMVNVARDYGPWNLTFDLDVVASHSVLGTVKNSSGTLLPGVPIEYWGAVGGTNVTDEAGSFAIHGLPTNGTVKVRVLPDAYAKSTHQAWDLALGDGTLNFTVTKPSASFSTQTVAAAVQHGLSTTASFMVTNSSSDALDFECLEMPASRVALISDAQQLNPLATLLESFGLSVSVYSNNYEMLYSGGEDGVWTGIPTTHYSSDDAIVFGHDLVIADLSGLHSAGRLFTDDERDVFKQYLDMGGKLIVTGANPLSSPDSPELMALVGASTLDQLASVTDVAVMTNALPADRFVDLDVGDRLTAGETRYDLATPKTFGDATATAYFKAGDASKLMRRTVANSTAPGRLYYWGGNLAASEWRERGVWQDVLKGIVVDELATDLSWVSLAPETNSVASGSVTVQVTLNAEGALGVGTNSATVLVLGNYPGEDARAVQLVLDVAPVTLSTMSETGVTNWLGEYITGDGTLDAALFQVVWAGPNGAIDPPAADGAVTGDDRVLARYPSGEAYGRFGVGYENTPDHGQFAEIFTHGLAPTSSSRRVYVRAWDAATIATSVAYGDSTLYTLTNEAYEEHDYGTWGVGTVPSYPGGGKDSNGDSIYDGWYVMNGLDARTPVAALTSQGTQLSTFGSSGSGSGQFDSPVRVCLWDNYVCVLDKGNNRIQIWDRASETFAFAYSPTQAFSQPLGMAMDPRDGVYRFAVADTGNDTVRVFTFDPLTGEITEKFSIGSRGSDDGEFINPSAVAFDIFGYIFVADTDNHRVQVFTESGEYARQFGKKGETAGEFNYPRGIYIGPAGAVYVADTMNHRVQILNGSTGVQERQFGDEGSVNGLFSQPTDVKIGISDRIFVMDSNNSRAQVFLKNGGAFDHILTFGSLGNGNGQLKLPFGITPVPTSTVVYVADTFNNRVSVFDTVIDADGDGMDDEWEERNELSDALGDADGDGIFNIGEYRIKTDANDADSDGDEWSDGKEICQGLDPLDPQYSLFRITSVTPLPGLELHYMGETGETYRVETTTNLQSGVWTTVPQSIETAAGDGIISFTNSVTPGEAGRFYRAVRIDE